MLQLKGQVCQAECKSKIQPSAAYKKRDSLFKSKDTSKFKRMGKDTSCKHHCKKSAWLHGYQRYWIPGQRKGNGCPGSGARLQVTAAKKIKFTFLGRTRKFKHKIASFCPFGPPPSHVQCTFLLHINRTVLQDEKIIFHPFFWFYQCNFVKDQLLSQLCRGLCMGLPGL